MNIVKKTKQEALPAMAKALVMACQGKVQVSGQEATPAKWRWEVRRAVLGGGRG